MTIIDTVRAPRDAIAAHVYTLPVVRELPPQPPDGAHDERRDRLAGRRGDLASQS